MTKPQFLSDKQLNILRGKTMANAISKDEVMAIFAHLDALESKLDELDYDDALGTEGWRNTFNVPVK